MHGPASPPAKSLPWPGIFLLGGVRPGHEAPRAGKSLPPILISITPPGPPWLSIRPSDRSPTCVVRRASGRLLGSFFPPCIMITPSCTACSLASRPIACWGRLPSSGPAAVRTPAGVVVGCPGLGSPACVPPPRPLMRGYGD